MHYNHKNKQTGFTLVEVMMVIVIIGVVLSFAMPAFRQMQRNSCMTSTTNNFIASINLARSEAAKLNNQVYVIATNDTDASNEWGNGWRIQYTRASDNQDIVIRQFEPSCEYLTLNAVNMDTENYPNTGELAIEYEGAGFSEGSSTNLREVRICDPNINGERGRSITISGLGRPNVDSQYTCT